MSNLTDLFYFFIGGVALLLSVLGLWVTTIMPGIDRWNKRFFRVYFIFLMMSCLFSFIEIVLCYFPVPNPIVYFFIWLESLLLPLPLPMLTVYLLHCCGENMRSSRLLRAVLCLWAVYLVVLAIAPFTDGFSCVTPDKQWCRGPLYPLLLLPIAAIMLLNLTGTIQRRKQLSHKGFIRFLIAILPITAVLLVQMFVDVFPLIDISLVLSVLSMYGHILSDQIELELCHQREIANQRASIMVMQMRPHFIYNTMTSIYCLCNQDPTLARQVILDFTTYLRKNFTAIASSTPIPFSSELEHTRAYLAVEQAQYQDSLSVDYDIRHTCFRLPPLTLQPIVENAVKHGRDPYAGTLHVSIRTRKTDPGSEIVVADNGRGFVPADDGESHIALKNIQERLEIMCGGRLTVTSQVSPGDFDHDGGGRARADASCAACDTKASLPAGTVVTVTIPDSGELDKV
ncbi:MAG: histidine kinase [Fretibacterium sp.]|nr:histidine kinase [Fretibacterium sp.]